MHGSWFDAFFSCPRPHAHIRINYAIIFVLHLDYHIFNAHTYTELYTLRSSHNAHLSQRAVFYGLSHFALL